MITYIRGELVDILENKVIVDVNGIGYGISMPQNSMNLLPPCGAEVKIYTYLNVKEDSMKLFGFLGKDDLEVFKLVIGVNGIGPKGGLALLSHLTPDELRFAVFSNDVKAISGAQGIGKKTAEKLILELKDKLKLEDALEEKSTSVSEEILPAQQNIQKDAVAALVALGYGNTEALKAVRLVKITEEMQVEDVLKQALKHVMF